MTEQLGIYLLPKDSTGAWLDITENVLHTSINGEDTVESDLEQFSFDVNKEIYDGDDNPVFLQVGDKVCITNNDSRLDVFYDCYGLIINPGQASTGGYITSEDRGHNRYSVTVRKIDPSYLDVSLDYKTPTALSTIVLALLDSNTIGLGGTDINNIAIPKFKLLCPDALISSFEFKGSALSGLQELLTPIKYNFRIVNYCKPDATLTLKVISQIEIFQSGSPPNDSAFFQGITNDDIKLGGTPNLNYDPNNPVSQPYLLFGESDFNVTPDFDSVINRITVIGLVQNGTNLFRYYQKLGGARESTFKLGYKFKDILFAARLLKSEVDTASVPTYNPITFSIDEFAAEKIENYDQVKADYLVCRIVHDDIEYFYRFTVSGQLVTLGILAHGSTELPEALDYGDLFEMVKSVSIYEDNRENLEGYPLYGAVKNCQLTNTEATLRFLSDDVPRSFDEVVIYGYKLEDYKETHNYWDSIRAYGVKPYTEELNVPVTSEQLQKVLLALKEQTVPMKQVTFKSLRPGRFKAGYEFKVKVTGKCDEVFTATSVKWRYISKLGQKGNHLVEHDITMGTKRISLADTISELKTSYEKQNTIVSRGNEKDRFHFDLFLSFLSDNNYLNAPVALPALFVDSIGYSAMWSAPSGYPAGASGFYFDAWDSEDNIDPNNPTVYIWHNKVMGFITNARFEDLVSGKTRRYRLRAFNSLKTSGYSNIITVSSYEFDTDADQIINLRFNDSNTTVTNEAGYNGTLTDVDLIHSGTLGSTTRYVGPFTDQVITIPHDADFNDIASFTIKFYGRMRDWVESNVLNKESGVDGSFRFQFSWNGFVVNKFAPYIDIYDSNGSHPRLLVYPTDFEIADLDEYFCYGIIWNRTTKTMTLIKNSTQLTKAVYAPNASFHALESDFNGGVIWNTANNIRIGSLPTGANFFNGEMYRLYMTKRALDPADLITEFQNNFGVS